MPSSTPPAPPSSADDDSNPFSRPSAWPKMPQAPFRIGLLPKAGAPAPKAEPQSQSQPQSSGQPQRPPAGLIAVPHQRGQDSAVPGFFGSGPMGGAMHGAAFLPSGRKPPPSPTDEPAAVAFPVAAAAARAAPGETAERPAIERPPVERPPIEVAEVEVVGRRRAPPPQDDADEHDLAAPEAPLFIPQPRTAAGANGRRKLVFAAGVAAVLGLGALGAYFANRGPAPTPAAPAPQVATAPQPPAATNPPQAPLAATSAPGPVAAPTPAAPARQTLNAASTHRRAAVAAPAASPASTPDVTPPAPEPAPPTLIVPPPAPVIEPPPTAAPPAPPRKPPPSDPSAPIATKPTYSE